MLLTEMILMFFNFIVICLFIYKYTYLFICVFLRHSFPAYFVMPRKCNANNMQRYSLFF